MPTCSKGGINWVCKLYKTCVLTVCQIYENTLNLVLKHTMNFIHSQQQYNYITTGTVTATVLNDRSIRNITDTRQDTHKQVYLCVTVQIKVKYG